LLLFVGRTIQKVSVMDRTLLSTCSHDSRLGSAPAVVGPW
jgi:hypothetical protein